MGKVSLVRVEFPSRGKESETDDAERAEDRLLDFFVAPAKARLMLRAPEATDDNGRRVKLTPEAQVVSRDPLVLRLNKWAAPRYARIWRWTTRSEGFSMMGGPMSTAVIPVSERR